MVRTFEDFTDKLSPKETEMIKAVAEIISNHVGRKNAIRSIDIQIIIKEKYNYRLAGSRLRAVIHVIVVNNILSLLCATQNGYFVAENEKEVTDYIESLKNRCNAINEKKTAISDQLFEMKAAKIAAEINKHSKQE